MLIDTSVIQKLGSARTTNLRSRVELVQHDVVRGFVAQQAARDDTWWTMSYRMFKSSTTCMSCSAHLNSEGRHTLSWRVPPGMKRDVKPSTPPRTSSSTMRLKGAMLGWPGTRTQSFSSSHCLSTNCSCQQHLKTAAGPVSVRVVWDETRSTMGMKRSSSRRLARAQSARPPGVDEGHSRVVHVGDRVVHGVARDRDEVAVERQPPGESASHLAREFFLQRS